MIFFALCPGYKMSCCASCRRWQETATDTDDRRAKGKRMIVPQIYNGKCMDWAPQPDNQTGREL